MALHLFLRLLESSNPPCPQDRFPLITLLMHALLECRNPLAPPPQPRGGNGGRTSVLHLTTPERYQQASTWPTSRASQLFFKRFQRQS